MDVFEVELRIEGGEYSFLFAKGAMDNNQSETELDNEEVYQDGEEHVLAILRT